MALPGIYRVQSVAEIPIVRRNKYQAQNREKTWELRETRFSKLDERAARNEEVL